MRNSDNISPINILLVEDNPADVRLTVETLKKDKVSLDIQVAHDGEEALAYLRQQGPFIRAVRPDLILLDLNLPKIDGREVLREIKSDENLKSIPVVVLTSSQAEEDVCKTYQLHANCYITKPVDLHQFARVARLIQEFWFTIVKLPAKMV